MRPYPLSRLASAVLVVIATPAWCQTAIPSASSAIPAANIRSPVEPALNRAPKRKPNSRPVIDVAAANRAATVEPAAHGFINATQVYPFAEGLIFQLYASPGRITDIALQAGEVLVSVASGDTVRWVIGDTVSGTGPDKRTHVLVKPFSAGLHTNLVINTDRRSYHLALTSTGAAAMAAISWTYPQDVLIAVQRASEMTAAAEPVAAGLEIERLRFDYTITGDRPTWRPLRAFDDGQQTFIEFPETIAVGEAPPLFLVDSRGEAQLVNYRLRGRFYVVDRLFDAAELRLGTKHQDIVRISRMTGKRDRSRS